MPRLEEDRLRGEPDGDAADVDAVDAVDFREGGCFVSTVSHSSNGTGAECLVSPAEFELGNPSVRGLPIEGWFGMRERLLGDLARKPSISNALCVRRRSLIDPFSRGDAWFGSASVASPPRTLVSPLVAACEAAWEDVGGTACSGGGMLSDTISART